MTSLINDLPSTLKVFILGTSQKNKNELDKELQDIFEYEYEINNLKNDEKLSMFKNLFIDLITFSKIKINEKKLKELTMNNKNNNQNFNIINENNDKNLWYVSFY